MKYKSVRDLIYQYVLLSDFNRGFFWGIIFAWTAVISSMIGAIATKIVYLDKQQTIVVKNQAFPYKQVILPKSADRDFDTYPKVFLLSFSDNNFALLSELNHGNSSTAYLTFSSKTRLNKTLEFDPSISYPSSIAKFSKIKIAATTIFDNTDNRLNFQNSPIVIKNQTNSPKLALEISFYLQDREFNNIAIVNNLETKSYLSQTTIIAPPANLKVARHLQNILNFGNIELISDYDLDRDNEPKIILNLGEDAKFFSYNQNFLYSVE